MNYVLIGGGLASANAADAIRQVDKEGSITIVGKEDYRPYDRPPLSKGFLQGDPASESDIESRHEDFYVDNRVDLISGVKAEKIDREAKTVSLSNGTTLPYDRLLIATGATPRPLGLPGADLENVCLLRTVDDSLHIRAAASLASSAVMIGAGYIGMEVGAHMAAKEVSVVIVTPDAHPWGKFASETTGQFLRKYFEGKGVQFVFNDQVEQVLGENTVEGVRTKGGVVIPTAMVVAGIGVTLNLQLAIDAGLEVDPKEGVVVDEFFQTSDPNIWTAGDISYYNDINFGKRWHIEHYMNAMWQGERAGLNMAGKKEPFDKVPYFFSDLFDLHMVLRGDAQSGKSAKVLGDVDSAEFIDLYANDTGTLVMGLAFTRDENRQEAISDNLEAMIRGKKPVAELSDSDFQ